MNDFKCDRCGACQEGGVYLTMSANYGSGFDTGPDDKMVTKEIHHVVCDECFKKIVPNRDDRNALGGWYNDYSEWLCVKQQQ